MTDRGVSDPAPYDPGYGPLVETHVRIATWNIWARYGPWEERAPVIESTLREIDADIVGLQEVWDDGTRNQARSSRPRSATRPRSGHRTSRSPTACRRATR